MAVMNKKILVLTSCSAKKKRNSKRMKAIELYDGDLFKLVKKFVTRYKFDLKIVSAKYGLISSEEKIEYYNKIIKDKNDIEKLKELVNPKLKKIVKDYLKVLIIMGEDYKKIIEPIKNEKFVYFFDKRGLGGYLSLMSQILKMKENDLFKLLFEEKTITINLIKQSIY